MSKSILNLYYRDTLDKVDSYEEYLSSMNITLDTQLWKKSLSLNSKNAYQKYLNEYLKGNYAYEAQLKIDNFNAVEEREQENKIALEKEAIVEQELKKFIKWADKNNISEEKIPRDINKLKQLEVLDLRYLKLDYVPDSIGFLSNLSELSLGGNYLQVLPSSIGNLKQLTSLSLWQNKLNKLPSSFQNLSNLARLDLSENNFSIFPECVKELNKLKSFDIGCGTICTKSNQIAIIPDWLYNLVSLTSLNLSGLGLKELSNNICKLKKLKYLGLYHNELSEIPSCIGELNKLEYLLLNVNELTNLPISLNNLNNLEYFDIGGNFSLYIEKNELKKFSNMIQEKYNDIPGKFFLKIIKKFV